MLIAYAVLGQRAADEEDWASSPQAYFLTSEERGEWKTLDSRDSRQKFIERYWLKRDPTPGTEKNEFRDTILSRIKTADERFRIQKTPGSRTARGLVFIVLGTPARTQDRNAPPPPPDPGVSRRVGQGVTPVAMVEGNETTSTWFYDRDRTPRILEAIGRPSFDVTIVVEPSRHIDSIQNPGLFNEVKEIVARKSIVNPDLVPAAASGVAAAASLPLLPVQPLAAATREILQTAPAAPRKDRSFIGSAVVFHETGNAETFLWAFTPSASRRASLHLLVRTDDGREVATVTEPAAVSPVFSTSSPGLVALRRLPLPPGSYSASVALTEDTGNVLAAAMVPVQVPSLEKGFAASSLIVTRGPGPAGTAGDLSFTFAGTAIPPRADAVFKQSESLWYFLEVANPTDPGKVVLDARLRRGSEQVGALPLFPVKLSKIAGDRYLCGVEMPLSTLEPGDYLIYVTVRDGEGSDRSVLRRAEFRVER